MKRTTTSKAAKLTGALALTFALGGGLFANASVHADPAEKTSVQLPTEHNSLTGPHELKPPGDLERELGPLGGRYSDELISLLGISAEQLKKDLQAGHSIAEIAAKQNVKVQTIIDKLVTTEKNELQQQLASGKITQKQYDERISILTNHVTKLVKEKWSKAMLGKHEQHEHGRFEPELERNLDKLASLLGISTHELRSSLRSGHTVAKIATNQHVNVKTIISKLETAEKSDLKQELKDGKLTQAQYDKRVADLTERVTNWVNGKRSEGGLDHPLGLPHMNQDESKKASTASGDVKTEPSTGDSSKNPA